jgi:hypothetical protein
MHVCVCVCVCIQTRARTHTHSAFIVHPPKLISIMLHESHISAHQLATLHVDWLQDHATIRAKWRASHLNLIMEDVCGERRCPGGGAGGGGGGGECVWGANDIARPRIECLFLSVEVVSDGGGGGVGAGGDGWERHRERQQRQERQERQQRLRVARLAVEVNGSCFGQGV